MAVSYQEIGRRIASYRNELGLSQEVVAERMGISRAVLSKIENGQKAVNAMELQAACTALGVDLNDLIEERPHSLVSAFMGSAKTEPARQAIKSVDRLVQEYVWQLRIAEGESPC
jgi:transcriptional regulator with XRE-family HTH domain